MFPTEKLQIKSYYKGKITPATFPSNVGNVNSVNQQQQPNTIIRFAQKDYYGDDLQVSSTPAWTTKKQQLADNKWWSRTFIFSMFPFTIFGCPTFHLLENRPFSSTEDVPMDDTKRWLNTIFSVKRFPRNFISCLYLVPATLMNAYTMYTFGLVFNALFINPEFSPLLFRNLFRFIQYFLLVLPIDYVWLHGYKIQRMLSTWNSLYSKYHGAGCISFNFRFRVFFMVALVGGIFGIRYVTRLRHILVDRGDDKTTTRDKIETIMEFVVELGHCLLLPLYCTFCYAVKAHLCVIKALVYQWIWDRVTPAVSHLNTVKILYTQASDCILRINGWFYRYLSVVIAGITLETLIASPLPYAGFIMPSLQAPLMGIMTKMNSANGLGKILHNRKKEEENLDQVREFNLELVGIALSIGMIYWTIWQAVKTNDCAREIHVWLNDLAIGGSGVDVRCVLRELGIRDTKKRNNDDNVLIVTTTNDDAGIPMTRLPAGNDEFVEKLRLLKAYIHVRMELEDAALLNMAIVGMLRPDLSGRLARYRVVF